MANQRLFVAMAVPDHVRDRIAGALSGLRGRDDVNWTRPDGWHVTLAFLGNVEEERVVEVVGVAESAVVAAAGSAGVGDEGLVLSLGAPGTFKDRVAWLAVEDDPSGAVATIGAALQASLAEEGLPVDRKDVHPHLTLARARGRRLPGEVIAALPTVSADWRVDDAVLYRSVLGDGPARYEVVERLPLVAG